MRKKAKKGRTSKRPCPVRENRRLVEDVQRLGVSLPSNADGLLKIRKLDDRLLRAMAVEMMRTAMKLAARSRDAARVLAMDGLMDNELDDETGHHLGNAWGENAHGAAGVSAVARAVVRSMLGSP